CDAEGSLPAEPSSRELSVREYESGGQRWIRTSDLLLVSDPRESDPPRSLIRRELALEPLYPAGDLVAKWLIRLSGDHPPLRSVDRAVDRDHVIGLDPDQAARRLRLEMFGGGRAREQWAEAGARLGLRIPTRRERAPARWCLRVEVRGGNPAAERAVLAHEHDGPIHRSAKRRPTNPAAPTRRGSGTFVRQSTSSAARKTSRVVMSTITCV